MALHRATIRWAREGSDFEFDTFSRDHLWEFGDAPPVAASAAPAFVGTPGRVDPEQALTAALSSCHMLTFLAICANKGIMVDRYRDAAAGELGRNARGRTALTRVVLRPEVQFAGEPPDPETLAALHERAHRGCFIANSVTTDVVIEVTDSAEGDRVE